MFFVIMMLKIIEQHNLVKSKANLSSFAHLIELYEWKTFCPNTVLFISTSTGFFQIFFVSKL
jgi:hypothetical protein